ncbi:hypothetical protein SDC9_133769 [bioreactor metagenome]|uniref:Uncharacterized protein n=1 Tax=bioreactor metagenome TaxID=1076179 RepID=A0A645DCD5_9ZZZZ
MLGIRQVHIADSIHDHAVHHLRHVPVPAAVARLHVENGDFETLCGNRGEGGVGIPQHQERIRPLARHHGIAFGDDVAHRLAEILPHTIEVIIRRAEPEIVKEDLIERIVVILPRVHQNMIKIAIRAGNHRREADDLRPGAEYGHEFEFGHSVFSTSETMVSGRAGSKHSSDHMTVTISVLPVFSMLWV